MSGLSRRFLVRGVLGWEIDGSLMDLGLIRTGPDSLEDHRLDPAIPLSMGSLPWIDTGVATGAERSAWADRCSQSLLTRHGGGAATQWAKGH
jgi:hypothetical protein